MRSAWLARAALAVFTLALLYPLAGLLTPVGAWQWDGAVPASTAAAIRVSLSLTGLAMLLDVVLGTPVAFTWRARRAATESCGRPQFWSLF